MRSLFLNAARYLVEKPGKNEVEQMQDCLVVLVSFEAGDDGKAIRKFIQEIRRMARRLHTNNLVLAPFCHLSSKLLDGERAESLLEHCANRLRGKFNLLVSEFGVDKSLLLDVRSGKNSIKHRSF